MAHCALKRSLLVCLVAQNRLAEAFLRQVLSRQKQVHTVTPREYFDLSPWRRKDTVFVVDLCGLEVPLIECLRQLRPHSVNAKFLVLDQKKSIDEIVKLLIMGAHGFLSHQEVGRALTQAVFFVASNQIWVPAAALHQFLCEVSSTLRKEGRRVANTPREEEILDLVRRRFTNKEIARFLEIRLSTVKFHVSNILSKMHAHNRRDLLNSPVKSIGGLLGPLDRA